MCHYSGMALSEHDVNDKLTVRLPRKLLDALRAVSDTTGASLNSVAVQAMSVGWPNIAANANPEAVLASRTTQPASKAYDGVAIGQLVEPLRPLLSGLGDDVMWARGNR